MNEFTYVSLFAGLVFLLAGTVKGITGMGLPTVAMGLLGLVMAPVQAAALLIIPSLATNLWQMAAGPHLAKMFKRFATMMAGIALGTFAGIGLLVGGDGRLAPVALGAVLACYGTIGLVSLRLRVSHRAEIGLSPLIGLITGILTGATGIFVVPAVPYLGSLNLEKEELIQALGLSFTVSTIALGMGLAANGQFHFAAAGGSLLALAPALGGMLIGQRIRERLSPERFRRWFFIALILLGAVMVARALART